MADSTAVLPAHVEETVAAIAQLHADHNARATPTQRTIESLTRRAAKPSFIVTVVLAVALWLAFNLIMVAVGVTPIDPPPFYWMQGLIGLAALLMTSMILSTQRRENEIATQREQLTLELSVLSEQKSAKIIRLLEELRRDSPHLANRLDAEAQALSMPVDPKAVMEAIKESDSASSDKVGLLLDRLSANI